MEVNLLEDAYGGENGENDIHSARLRIVSRGNDDFDGEPRGLQSGDVVVDHPFGEAAAGTRRRSGPRSGVDGISFAVHPVDLGSRPIRHARCGSCSMTRRLGRFLAEVRVPGRVDGASTVANHQGSLCTTVTPAASGRPHRRRRAWSPLDGCS
ncbi:hypothetical protein ACP70R_007975 [Stipagrostis hirtigluma subsp. patula]